MNDTNLVVLLMKILADQKAAAPAAGNQWLIISTMIINTVLTPLVTAVVVYLNKRSSDIKLDKQTEKLDEQSKVLEQQSKVQDEQTAITKEIKTDVNSERTAMLKTVSDLRDEVRKLAVEKQELQSDRKTENGKFAAGQDEIAELAKTMKAMSEELAALKSAKA